MDKLLVESVALNAALLVADEEQYDKEATSLVAGLQKLSIQQLASKEILQVKDVLSQHDLINVVCRLLIQRLRQSHTCTSWLLP